MKTNLLISALTASLSIPMALAAQEPQPLDDVIILSDNIQIPFKKQNRNIQILTRVDIEQLPVKSTNELLAYIAGIDVRQRGVNGAQADISIDGGTFDQTLVLLNGMKMSDPQTGHNMMNIPIALDAIERIEVLKGAAARIYGVNALMGVINIVTTTHHTNRIVGRTYMGSSLQQDDSTGRTYMNYGIQATANIHSLKTSHVVAAGYDESNGYRYNTANTIKKIFYQGKYNEQEAVRLEWSAGAMSNAFGANLFYAAPNDKEAIEQVDVIFAALKGVFKVNSGWTIQPMIHYKYAMDDYIYTRKNPSAYHNIHFNNALDATINNNFFTSYGTWTVGLNYRHEQINSTNLGERKRHNFGMFLSYQQSFLDNIDLGVGMYVNHNSIFGWNVYPGIDVGVLLTHDWRLYANAGMGQRLPTFTDLYYSGPNNIGNVDLVPEKAITYELGIKKQQGDFHLNAAALYKYGTSFIDWIRVDTSQAWEVHNFTTLKTFGLHMNAAYLWQMNKQWQSNWYVGYTYLKPSIGNPSDESKKDYMSQYAINALKHQWILRGQLTYNKLWNVSVQHRLLERYNTTNEDAYKKHFYQLLDFRTSYQLKNIQVYVDINNVLDVKFIESGVVPLPGRWMTVGVVLNHSWNK